MGRQIKYYFRNTPSVCCIREKKILGTSGGVRNARKFLGDTFIVVHGDTLTNLNISNMLKLHQSNKALATIAVISGSANGSGLIDIDKDYKVLKFSEKTQAEGIGLINAGIYILEKEIFDYIPNGFNDFGYNTFPHIIRRKLPVYGYELKDSEYIVDIGTSESYKKAKEMYEE